MRALIVEDDFTNRRLMQVYLRPFGESDVAVDGQEALHAFRLATEAARPYHLICLDIMMPVLDGQTVLKHIRAAEAQHGILLGSGVKVIVTTVLSDVHNVMNAFQQQCDGYLVKPIERAKLLRMLEDLQLIAPAAAAVNA